MFRWLMPRSTTAKAAATLYEAVVAMSRQPLLYRDCGVPDTPEGRYEMLVLHLFFVIERLRAIDGANAPEAGDFARELTSVFVTDMDDNFREMGVGDLKVPRKVKKAAAGLYDRVNEYRELQQNASIDALARAVGANCGITDDAVVATPFADYLMEMTSRLATLSDADLLAGHIPSSRAVDFD